MAKRHLIDRDKLFDVLLQWRDGEKNNYKERGFDGDQAAHSVMTECAGIVSHFPTAEETDRPWLKVSDIKYIFCKHSTIVLKRADNGREYRKIDLDRGEWEVTGFYPRIRSNGDDTAVVELVVWCVDRCQSTKDILLTAQCDYYTKGLFVDDE